MAFFFDGGDYMESTAPVTAVPLTIAGWFRGTTTDSTRGLIELNSGGNTNYFSIRKVSGSLNIRGTVRLDNGTEQTVSSTGTYTQNDWFHAAFVCESATLRTIYLNGGNEANSTVSVVPSGINTMFIGFAGAYWTGDSAEVAIWNAALTKSQVESLAKGFAPSLVQPDNLVQYMPLIRNVQDLIAARLITNNGPAAVATHPRIYGL